MKTVLSPKELGTAIGVSESSLKRWADSGRLHVARTAGGHRRIHLEEAVRFIRDSGFAVQRPDLLGLDDIGRIDRSMAVEDPAEQFYLALVEGRAEQARGIALNLYLEGMALEQVVDDVIAPAMARLGELWEHSPEGIFYEHRASDICNQTLNRIRSLVAANDEGAVAVGGAPEDDPYVLPSLMAATVLACEGWSEINLGAFTPLAVLARAAAECEAQLVWLALSVNRSTEAAEASVNELLTELARAGSEASVVVGGPCALQRAQPAVAGVYCATSMSELAAFARGLRESATDPQRPGRS